MLHPKLKKLIEDKRAEKPLHPLEQKAKAGVLGAVKDFANQALGDKLNGLKKVTVASNDPEGLELGLDKAKKMLADKAHGEDMSPEEDEDLSPEDEGEDDGEYADGDDEEEHEEEEHLTPEQIDAKIQELLALKDKMSKGPRI